VLLVAGAVPFVLVRLLPSIGIGLAHDAQLEMAWATTCLVGAAGAAAISARRYARLAVVTPLLVLTGLTAYRHAELARIVFAHLHNVIAIVLWGLLFRARKGARRAMLAPLICAAVGTVLLVAYALSSPQLAACFPHAKSTVTVDLTTDAVGKDKFRIVASGLKPNTDFTVFLIEKAGAPFGAVEYIGDFTTDSYGKAANTFRLIVEEAFAFNNETQIRKELNSVGFWFADPKDDNGCLGAGSPVTQFDGDASAGVQMMNSGVHKLP